MGYAGEREETMAAGLKKFAGQNESTEYGNMYKNLISPFKRTCYASRFGATCFYRLLCEP